MQPRYPLAELRPYVRESDGVKCFAPVFKKPKDMFVQQARAIWGDRYDYTDSVYTYNKEPIIIFCPKHQYHFRVAMAQNHVMKAHGTFKPTGCPICAAEKRHGREYGPDWREYLKPSKKNSYVGLIHHKSSKPKKSPEQIAAEQRIKEERRRQREAAEQALIDRYQAKDINEAHFVEKLIARYGDIYGRQLLDYQGRETKVTLVCPEHGPFRISPRVLLNGEHGRKPHGCWQCAGLSDPDQRPKPVTAADVVAIIRKKKHHAFSYIYEPMVDLKHNRATFHCHLHGDITHSIDYWMNGGGCEYCDGKKFWPGDFLRLAREVHGRKFRYRGVKNITKQSDCIEIHCLNPDHHWHLQHVDRHLAGDGCRECAGRHQSREERIQMFISQCIDKYGPDRYDYSRVHEDYVNNDSLVWIRCCVHDHWFQTTPDNNLRTVNGSCPICSLVFKESNGEAEIRRWLVKHGVTDFQQDEMTIQHNNPQCKRAYLRPDFWLPAYNLFIEYNGEQHYEDVSHFFNADWTFEDQLIRDATLRDWCRSHGRRLLEIPYWEFDHIDSILSSVLLNHEPIPTFEPPATTDTQPAPTEA